MYYRLNTLLFEEQKFIPITLEGINETNVLWGQGLLHTDPVLTPLSAVLSSNSGQVMPDFAAGHPPIISIRFAEALTKAGVDNLQLFDIEITDHRNGIVYKDYKAMNIIGAVSCVNLTASKYKSTKIPRMNFIKLVLDESRTMGLHMFRLAESLRYIMISQQVCDALMALPLVGVRISSLDDPDAYIG